MGFFDLFGGPNFKKIVETAPNQIGVYLAKLDGEVMYVGRAIEDGKGLRKRSKEHYRGDPNGKSELYKYRDKLVIQIKTCNSVEEAKQLEAKLIRKYDTVENGWNNRYED